MEVCKITESAKKRINDICQQSHVFGVTLNIKGGGCAGFEYVWDLMALERDLTPIDVVINTGSGNLVICGSTSIFIRGSEIDFTSSLRNDMLQIKNPNEKYRCGCGFSANFDYSLILKNTESGVKINGETNS